MRSSRKSSGLVRAVAGAVVLAACLLPAVAIAQDAAPGGAVDPSARSRLERVAAAYQALENYADEGRFVVTRTPNAEAVEHVTPMSFAVARDAGKPTRFRIEAGTVRVVADGERLTAAIRPTRTFLDAPQPADGLGGAVAEGPAGAELLGGPGTPAARVLLALLFSPEPLKLLLEPGTGLAPLPDQEIEGRVYDQLILAPPAGLAIRLTIDRDSNLITRMDLVEDHTDQGPTADGKAHALAGPRLRWSAGRISLEPGPPEVFQAKAEPGYSAIKQP